MVPNQHMVRLSGSCDNSSEQLNMSWTNHMAEVDISLEFSKTNKGDNFSLSAVHVDYTLIMKDEPSEWILQVILTIFFGCKAYRHLYHLT